MPDTRILIGLDLSLTNIRKVSLFIDRMPQQPEFKDSATSRATIETLKAVLKYSEKQLNILVQRAAAHSLKKE